MARELPKVYEPQQVENKIYKMWEDNGYFRPTRTLTRAEAASILSSTAILAGIRSNGAQAGFADSGTFAVWAASHINFCGVTGIMSGDNAQRFNPNGSYTREQAIITMLNLYDRL